MRVRHWQNSTFDLKVNKIPKINLRPISDLVISRKHNLNQVTCLLLPLSPPFTQNYFLPFIHTKRRPMLMFYFYCEWFSFLCNFSCLFLVGMILDKFNIFTKPINRVFTLKIQIVINFQFSISNFTFHNLI